MIGYTYLIVVALHIQKAHLTFTYMCVFIFIICWYSTPPSNMRILIKKHKHPDIYVIEDR